MTPQRSGSLPILRNVLVEVNDDEAVFTASNMEATLSWRLRLLGPAVPFRVALPVRE